MVLKVIKLDADALVPTKSYENDLGYDLYSSINVSIPPGTSELIPTGISVQFPDGWGGFIKDRSGFSTKTQTYIHAGVIDGGYRGELKVLVHNNSSIYVTINKSMKFAQLVLIPTVDFAVVEVDEFDSETDRGNGGFGSTGA